jgi:hypothetical protein
MAAVDEKGAVSALNNVKNQVEQLGPPILNFGQKQNQVFRDAENQVQNFGQAHAQTFGRMSGDYTRTRESAMLLTSELGIAMPRALQRVLAESTLIAPALSAAFNVIAIAGFVQLAGVAATKIEELVQWITKWDETSKSIMDSTKEMNSQTLKMEDHAEKLHEAYRLIGLEGPAKIAEEQKIANEKIIDAQNAVSGLLKQYDNLLKKSKETTTVTRMLGNGEFSETPGQPTAAAEKAKSDMLALDPLLQNARTHVKDLQNELPGLGKELSVAFSKEKRQGLDETNQMLQEALNKIQAIDAATATLGLSPLDAINQKERTATADLTRQLELYGDMPGVADRAAKAQTNITNAAARERAQIYEKEHNDQMGRMFDQNEEDARLERERIDRMQRAEIETSNIEREAAVAMLPPWQRSYAEVANAAEQMQQRIEELHRRGELTDEQYARQTAANATEEFAHMRDQVATDLEGAFDDLTSGKLGDRIKKMMKDMVFQMIAT